jgi:hypothetical protein
MATQYYGTIIPWELVKLTTTFIAESQARDGSIPWSENGVLDPWTHVENAMALDIGGYHEEAGKAYAWLAETQLDDGSWYASYQNGQPKDTSRVSHVISYIAVGVWHHYLSTQDKSFLQEMWHTIRSAIDFTLDMAGPNGEIYWARDANGTIYPKALVTGCSSIYLSLKSALSIASVLEEENTSWKKALTELARAIRQMPCPIEAMPDNRSVFAMDWYYPAMCCVVNGDDAKERIFKGWDRFVVEGFGSLCSLEQNWVTVAETSELALALAVHGEYQHAATVFSWLQQMRDSDGAYWYGVTLPHGEVWPQEKPTWTSAAVVLAADMFRHMSPTSLLLDHHHPLTL